jgi:GDP-mannose 6-dehydrogenase
LGYVGTVTAACLARDEHVVIGVDVNPNKVTAVSRGESPIIEPQVSELLAAGVAAGRLSATQDASEAVRRTEVSLISVGTPPTAAGNPDLDFVLHVCREIAEAVREKGTRHVVILRSTVPPGTLSHCRTIMSAIAAPTEIDVAFNPEFLREGSAVADYDNPPYTIIGTSDLMAENAVREMYSAIPGPVIVVAPEVAEMTKYISNSWHAVKISFANEMGRIAKSFGVDGRDAMKLMAMDTKLNISAAYLRPGFAYGGSCLPKDVSALNAIARNRQIPVPLLNSLPVSNAVQVDLAVAEIMRNGPTRIAVLGLAFKPDTDDLRESAAVSLVKRLLGEGCTIRIYDRDVHRSRLIGTNLEYIRASLPHFESLLTESVDAAIDGVETVVITYSTAEFHDAIVRQSNLRVIDLAGAFTEAPVAVEYCGSGW